MEFDRTFIKIRQRNIFEIADISLKVFKRYFKGLVSVGAICILPFALLNFVIFYPLLDTEFDDHSIAHWWLMTCLIVIQAPLATAAISQLLGTGLFKGEIKIWEALTHTSKYASRLIWIYLTRRTLAWTLVVWWLVWFEVMPAHVVALITTIVVGIELLVRSTRPYTNEIFLLEHAPMRTLPGDTRVNYKARNRDLHGPASGMLFGRGMVIGFVAIVICLSFYFLLIYKAVFDNQWQPDRWFLILLYPLALWMGAIYMAVVRFLAYIDLRTRQEGWDIELRIRAEANRLASKMSLGEKDQVGGIF